MGVRVIFAVILCLWDTGLSFKLLTPTALTRFHAQSRGLVQGSVVCLSAGKNDGLDDIRPGSMKAAIRELGVVPYGEESRQYRRTVYTQDDWLKHRSSTRLWKNLRGTFTSGVVRSLIFEVSMVSGIALLIVAVNCVLGGFLDLSNVYHSPLLPGLGSFMLQLPALPFTLSSPALGLLLVFRTNSSYQRWLEARTSWGRITAHLRNVIRQGATWLDLDVPPEDRKEVLEKLGLQAWVFGACLRWKLVPERAAVAAELRARMGAAKADTLLAARNPPLRALQDLSLQIVSLPMDEKRRVEMDKSCIIIGELTEVCERIFTSPVPLVYTRHTARFLSSWLLLLPFCLWESFGASWNHILVVPASALMAIFLFGVEELSVQLEEPFSILPLKFLCDSVRDFAEDSVV
mmetsp:Transcript_62773/g.107781  ORF Transcript_62773/g.107781 Transcript_62773/m.107781 type:complete len:404 (-) Transcript_62773:329-1540(-)